MVIDVDATPLLDQLTGIGVYTLNLLSGLGRRDDMLVRAHLAGRVAKATPFSLNRIMAPSRMMRKWDRLSYKWGRTTRSKAALFHGTNFFLPRWLESGIVTIHDLSVFRYPEAHPVERLEYFDREFEDSLRRARHVLTDSENGRQEVMEFAGLHPSKVTAVHLGVSPSYMPFRGSEDERLILARYGLQAHNYALCVATLEPRKRIDMAIRAHALMRRRTGSKMPLVVVGAGGWRNGSLRELIEIEQGKGTIILLGYVASDDLPTLYAAARLFVYLSVYEGFGLPPIEAMASGVPVIASDRSCLPEVTAGAAMLVNPDDLDSCVGAIERGLNDEAWRELAIQRGLQVAAGYTWDNCIENTINVYRKVWAEYA
ncbi:glycosyltransferase family 4 protein [Sphingobium sp. CR28]|uniref:glycosyltransferase family 4 protein n=1 Tax=Sphingobium sp. CR28 TaxID=3400272 RepID=UPI003FEEB551